ncbi:MAG: hypothetical protein WC729_28285 [Sphingomonas sp.]|jgi:hypothetical protein|uniref:hypothetical protein n=1 Tax=Sphingomonas sp. TaxID=28214 RepID=UPI0035673A1F
MAEPDANPIDHLLNPFAPKWMLPVLRLWQFPLMCGTAWWNASVDMLWPGDPERSRCLGDSHAQLVVPEPIESTGEHGLLA